MSYNSILEAIKTNSEINPGKLCVGDKKNKETYGQFWKMINKGVLAVAKEKEQEKIKKRESDWITNQGIKGKSS